MDAIRKAKPGISLGDQHREAAWVDKFVNCLSELGSSANPRMLVEMAHELFETQGDNDPVEIAQAEWDSWPPNDE